MGSHYDLFSLRPISQDNTNVFVVGPGLDWMDSPSVIYLISKQVENKKKSFFSIVCLARLDSVADVWKVSLDGLDIISGLQCIR